MTMLPLGARAVAGAFAAFAALIFVLTMEGGTEYPVAAAAAPAGGGGGMMARRAWRLAPMLLLAGAFALAGILLTPATEPASAHNNVARLTAVQSIAISPTPANGTDYRFGAVV